MSLIVIEAGGTIEHVPDPGTTIHLAAGRHERVFSLKGFRDVLIDGGNQAEIWRGGIELSDCQRVIVRGLTFRQSLASSIVINGPCQDCTIESCSFLACGIAEGNVTLWIGTNTQQITVRACHFDMLGARGKRHLELNRHCYDIAIMCAEEHCIEHRFIDNRIVQYSYGIQLGASGSCLKEGRHIVRGNRIEYPWADGIHIKQGRNLIERNTIIGAFKNAMSARAGFENKFSENIVQDGYIGLVIRGRDHEVVDNRFERCRRCAIGLMAVKANGSGFAAENTLVSGNYMLDCGGADAGPDPLAACAGIYIGNNLPQRINENTIIGAGASVVYGEGSESNIVELNGRGPTHPVHRS